MKENLWEVQYITNTATGWLTLHRQGRHYLEPARYRYVKTALRMIHRARLEDVRDGCAESYRYSVLNIETKQRIVL